MKIAIVEDEKLERESIKLLLSRLPDPPEIVFETHNGEESIRLFQENKPELILIDINLPGLTGIEVIRKIRAFDDDVEFVIISAYSEFTFAQEAIQLRVFDYLLKPYSNNKLYDVIKKLEHKLANAKEKNESVPDNQLFLEADKYMKRALFSYTTSEKVFDQWTVDFMEYFFRIKEQCLCCILLYPGDSGRKNIINWDKIEKRALNMLKPVIYSLVDQNMIILVRSQAVGNMDERIDAFLKFCRDFEDRQEIICARSEWVDNLPSLIGAFRKLEMGKSKSLKNYRTKNKNVVNLIEQEMILYKSIIKRDWSVVEHNLLNIDGIIREVNRDNFANSKAYYCFLWRQIDRYVYQATGKRKSTEDKYSIDSKLENAGTHEELIELILIFIKNYIEGLNFDDTDYLGRIVEKVKDYIFANIKGNLSLEETARMAGFSSFYLSKLFKKKEGISFKDYVIKIRMEKARQLLSLENMNIKQVAGEVGYPDANYFSRAFKKYAGFSARNYTGM